jgi:DNA invertase Pin-like site-specific DNA recombinase
MKISAYCRVSTDKDEQLHSLQAQRDFFTDFAVKNGHELVEIYADEGITGTSTARRTAFNRMLKSAERKEFELIVTKEVSRFARNTVDTLQYTRLLKSLGVGVLFLSDNINTLDNDGELRLSIMATLAQEESRKISSRVKFGIEQANKKGRVPTTIFGYDGTKINLREAEIIRKIYYMYNYNGFGTRMIAKVLNEGGIITKRGCKWGESSVSRILRNPIYIGKIVSGKSEISDFITKKRNYISKDNWVEIERPELQIVSNEEFRKANAEMQKRCELYNTKRGRHNSKYLLSTLIKCSECGWSYHKLTRYTNPHKWRCGGNLHCDCNNKFMVNEEELLLQIEDCFKEILQDKTALKRILDNQNKENNKGELNLTKDIKRISLLETKRKKYIEMYTDGIISKTELNDYIKKITNELRVLRSQIQDVKSIESVYTAIKNVGRVSELNNVHIKEIIEKITVNSNGEIEIWFNFV